MSRLLIAAVLTIVTGCGGAAVTASVPAGTATVSTPNPIVTRVPESPDLVIDPADVVHIVGALDELAAILDAGGAAVADGVEGWTLREGTWYSNEVNPAMVATSAGQDYGQAMIALLEKVQAGEDATAEAATIVALRGRIAALAPGAAPTPTPAPTPEPAAFTPITLSGRGSKVAKFKIPEDATAIARITHIGSSNFIVETIDSSGDTNDLLVNEIGRYAGTHLFDTDAHSVAFKIDADGRWKIVVKPVTSARAWDPSSRLTGKGTDVVRLAPASTGLTTLTLRHKGSSNFVVTSYSLDDYDLLVNEIGSYSGEVLIPDGTLLLTIEADGTWTGTPG